MSTYISLSTTKKVFVAAITSVFLLKLYLASQLELYSDEVFYWQASTHPAIGYSDLPFVTATLAGWISELFPGSSLAVRSAFLLLGTCIPLLVLWVSKPITGMRSAIESAILCLCVPLAASLGLLAVPDVPMIAFGLLSLGYLERAIRLDRIQYWIATGFFVALGLSTHYRFVLFPAAIVIFLLINNNYLRLWKNPGLWIAMALGFCGLIPIAWFNYQYDFASSNFYLHDRHPWQFHWEGLLHVFKQALIVTPGLYFFYILTIFSLWKLAKRGDDSNSLFLCVALANLLIYFVLAPWTDNNSTTAHWPLPGYIILTIFLPNCLRESYAWLDKKYGSSTAGKLILSIPALGFMGSLIGLAGLGSQAFQAELQTVIGPGVLSNKMAGWQEFAEQYESVLARHFNEDEVITVTDNYYTSAQLEFFGKATRTYNLDTRKAVNNGRAKQYEIWQQDINALTLNAGQRAIFITEDSELNIPEKTQIIGLACSYFDNLEFLEQFWLFGMEKRFSFYKTEAIKSEAIEQLDSCPFPSEGWLHKPTDGEIISGDALFTGWVFNEGVGVKELYLLIDGERAAQIQYGVPRTDVVQVMKVKSDPNAPNLGFDYQLDTLQYKNGDVEVSLEIINNAGERQIYGQRTVTILNL